MDANLIIIFKATIFFEKTYKVIKLENPVLIKESEMDNYKASEIRKINYVWGVGVRFIDLYFKKV